MLQHDRKHSRSVTILLSVLASVSISLVCSLVVVTQLNKQAGSVREIYTTEDVAVQRALSKNIDAVVSITAYKKNIDPSKLTGPGVELLFPELNGGVPTDGKRRVGGGSGFIVREDGYIVTNAHVVDDPTAEYTVSLNDGSEVPAKIVGSDPIFDIAIIKIEKKGLHSVTIGDSSVLFPGQTVIAIGNSLATFQNSVTKGIISGLGRQVSVSDDFGLNEEIIDVAIQTDAAINPGNSGGPLINLAGEVIGVNTAVSSRGQLIGFSIPVNAVKRIIEDAVKNGRITHPWLGVRYTTISSEKQQELGITQKSAAVIALDGPGSKIPAIAENSPAAKAGVLPGDIIVAVNKKDLDAMTTLAIEIAKYAVGDTIELSIIRNGNTQMIPVTLEEFPTE